MNQSSDTHRSTQIGDPYRHIFERAPQPMFVCGVSTFQILDVNDAAIKLYGHSREEFLHLSMRDVDTAPVLSISDISGSRKHVSRSGEVVVVELTASPLDVFDGKRAEILVVAQDVTIRSATANSLQEINDNLTNILKSLDEIIVQFDAEGTMLNVWTNDESRLRMPLADHFGKRLHDLIGEEEGSLVTQRFVDVISSKSVQSSDRKVEMLGTETWYQDIVTPVIKADGTCESVISFVRDVTARKTAEAKLKFSEDKYRQLLEQLDEIVFATDAAGNFTFLNSAWRTVTGMDVDRSFGKSLFDFLHESDREVAREFFSSTEAKDTASTRLTLRFIAHDRTVRWLDLNLQRAFTETADSDGFFGTMTDSTNRKRAEMAVSDQRELFRNVIDTDPNLIFVKDVNGKFQLANRAAAECYGTTVENLEGKKDADFNPHSEQVAEYHLADLHVLESMTEKFIAEEYVTDSTGNTRWLQTVKRPIYLPEAQTYGVLGISTDITQRKQYEMELAHRAFHDTLTKLPNRALFMERLGHALRRAGRQKKPTAAIFLDLDNFKVINDSLGHEAGDALLISVAERLTTSVRPGDTVARLGGDEFTILLEDLDDENEALGVAERIAIVLASKVCIGGHQISSTASLGIAVSHGEYDSTDAFLRDADTAMYEAKMSGKAHSVVFDLSMNARAVDRLEMEIGLRQALEHGEFVIHYQPIMLLDDGKICGTEALVRWQHPTKGIIPPEKFMSIAEETGLILPLGRWLLENACQQTKLWQVAFPKNPPLYVSVNLSTSQLQQSDIVEQVSAVLDRTGLDAAHLKLELTETVMIRDQAAIIPKLVQLQKLGVKIAIDDFGTGYSSMGYLSSLPLDTLKIDRKFINKMADSQADAAIVQAIVSLAKSLNLRITCEGIETSDQMDGLKKLGCDTGQGFFFAQPLTSDALTRSMGPAGPDIGLLLAA